MSEHRCGVQGFNPTLDGACPGCVRDLRGKWQDALRPTDRSSAREILIAACGRYQDWYMNGRSCDAGDIAYDLVTSIRMALEELE
jgi:hypothetical protein